MHQDGTEHLVVVGDGAVTVVLLGAVRTVDLLRGEIARAIDGEQVMTIQVGESLQPLAALQLNKQRLVQGTHLTRVKRIETLAQAGVARGPARSRRAP